MHKFFLDANTKIREICFDGSPDCMQRIKKIIPQTHPHVSGGALMLSVRNSTDPMVIPLNHSFWVVEKYDQKPVITCTQKRLITALQKMMVETERTMFERVYKVDKKAVSRAKRTMYAFYCDYGSLTHTVTHNDEDFKGYKGKTIRKRGRVEENLPPPERTIRQAITLPDKSKLIPWEGESVLLRNDVMLKAKEASDRPLPRTPKISDGRFLLYIPSQKEWFRCDSWLLNKFCYQELPTVRGSLYITDQPQWKWPTVRMERAGDDMHRLTYEGLSGFDLRVSSAVIDLHLRSFFGSGAYVFLNRKYRVRNISRAEDWKEVAAEMGARVEQEISSPKQSHTVITLGKDVRLETDQQSCVVLFTDRLILPVPLALANKLVYAKLCDFSTKMTTSKESPTDREWEALEAFVNLGDDNKSV